MPVTENFPGYLKPSHGVIRVYCVQVAAMRGTTSLLAGQRLPSAIETLRSRCWNRRITRCYFPEAVDWNSLIIFTCHPQSCLA